MQFIQERRRLILLVLVVVLLLCLVAVAAFNLLQSGGNDVADQPPTAIVEPTDEGSEVVITAEVSTPTPTRVIEEEPTQEATEESTQDVEPTAEPTPDLAIAATASEFSAPAVEFIEVHQVEEILENSGFEEGFSETTGVGLNWQGFASDSAVVTFSPEAEGPFVYDGSGAQRFSVQEAILTNRYVGIYQTVDVVAGEAYSLTIRGQVRTMFGNVNDSGYGYRVQYAVDKTGGQDWQAITDTAWVELPWGEEKLDTSQVSFSEYSTSFVAESDQATVFIRGWNKWADPKLVEYTLDSLSLVGPSPNNVEMVAMTVPGSGDGAMTTSDGGEMTASAGEATTSSTMASDGSNQPIDQALPVTGIHDNVNILTDGRFWGAIMVLTLLALGAVYQAKRR